MFNDIGDICWDFCDACRAGYGWENVDDIVCVCLHVRLEEVQC